MKQDLFSNLKLRRNDSNISIGGRALIPHKGSLNEAVINMTRNTFIFWRKLVVFIMNR